jgi:hypothetical protein
MFAALAKFRTIDRTSQRTIRPRRLAARPTGLVQSNDNRPSVGPVVAARPPRQPVLVARWQRNSGSGRLECHWIVETVDAEPTETPRRRCRKEINGRPGDGGGANAFGTSSLLPRRVRRDGATCGPRHDVEG